MATIDVTISLLRADDLLALEFGVVNMTLDSTRRPPALVKAAAGQPSFLIVEFPPQHVAEEVFNEDLSGAPIGLAPPPVRSIIAGRTRLAFQIPDAVDGIPLTVAGLLSWARLTPSLAVHAVSGVPAGQPPAAPSPQQTAIELPYRLLLSPDSSGGWTHTVGPSRRSGRAELWHTRLGVATGEIVDESRRPVLRAVWTQDFADSSAADPFPMALGKNDRKQIVALSSDSSVPGEAPLSVQRLALSALGAWADVGGAWDGASGGLAAWRQVVATGRDQYVRVLTRGFLYPFGHRAALVSVTERKLETSPDGTRAEYLMRTQRLVVSEPTRDYTEQAIVAAYPSAGREMPFQRVSIATEVTPPLDPFTAPGFPSVRGQRFLFHIVAEDRDGRMADFQLPLMFVLPGISNQAIAAQAGDAASRTADMRSQSIAYAPSRNPGDAQLTTTSMRFASQFGLDSLVPTFLPVFESATVAVPQIEALLGTSGVTGVTAMTLHDAYLKNEFDPGRNPSETFARLAGLPLKTPAEKAGVVTPAMTLNGISRSLGPVPNVDALVARQLAPIIASLDGNLLGGITLKKIIDAAVTGPIESQIPAIKTKQDAGSVEISFTWQPRLARINDPTSPDPAHRQPDLPIIITSDSRLTLDIRSVAPMSGGTATSSVSGTLTNFALDLFGIVVVIFDKLWFKADCGRKPELGTDGVHVEFIGPLSFVNQLAELMPADGFSSGASLQPTPEGIKAGYVLGPLAAGVGAFSLENIGLSAELELPFTGQPVGFRAAFSERFHPFLVTLSLVGGGGFLAVALNSRGIETIEGSLELGGNLTLSLGVVEANAHVLMGFHFGIKRDEHGSITLDFSAYVRAGASVDLLGIVGISVEFYLGLGFTPKELLPGHPSGILGILSGTAMVTVGVHLLFVDKSFTLSLERTFVIPARVGVPLVGTVSLPILADPSFDELVSVDDWQAYCAAFA